MDAMHGRGTCSVVVATALVAGCRSAPTTRATPAVPASPTVAAGPVSPASEPVAGCGEGRSAKFSWLLATPGCAVDCVPTLTAFTTPPPSTAYESTSWCERADGVVDGPFVRLVHDRTTRQLELVYGQYWSGRPGGMWIADAVATRTSPRPVRLAEQSYDNDGRLDGADRAWDGSGEIVLDETFEHGVRVGAYAARDPYDGTVASGELARGTPLPADLHLVDLVEPRPLAPGKLGCGTIQFTPPDLGASVPVGAWRETYADGSLVWTRQFDRAGRPDGAFCEIADNKARTCTLANAGTGTLRVSFADVGSPRAELELELQDGQLHGRLREWHWRDDKRRLVAERHYKHGQLDGSIFERGNDEAWGEFELRGSYCAGSKCGAWTTTTPSKRRGIDDYSRDGVVLAHRMWDDHGDLADHWTKRELDYYERGELPPEEKRRKHRACLESLAHGGGCCELDADPPIDHVCQDGPPHRR
jgi:hypothetical protein